jgi:phosphoglycolate phosphatase-like HAD superfamily hydrolase
MALTTVFLDMDGVLVDQTKLPLEYQRLLGEVLAPALGVAAEDWAEANRIAFPRWFAQVQARPVSEPPLERYDLEFLLSVRGMCEVLGRPAPPRESCIRLGRAADTHVRTHHQAFFPEAASVIRELASRYTVHFATGNPSWNIQVTIDRLGVADCVGLLCGPDRLGVLKQSPEFYPRLFRLAGLAPSSGVVVDDSEIQLEMAAQRGASTVLVGSQAAEHAPWSAVVPRIADLPRALRTLGSFPTR